MNAPENYTPVARELPPEGVVVHTISPGGIRQKLKRQGALWEVYD